MSLEPPEAAEGLPYRADPSSTMQDAADVAFAAAQPACDFLQRLSLHQMFAPHLSIKPLPTAYHCRPLGGNGVKGNKPFGAVIDGGGGGTTKRGASSPSLVMTGGA